jgi:hypothetical protein
VRSGEYDWQLKLATVTAAAPDVQVQREPCKDVTYDQGP